MKIYPENFNKLFFTEANFAPPIIEKRTLVISVKNLLPMKGHPLAGKGPIAGMLVFKGVHRSKRMLTEYIGDPEKPEGFKDPHVVEDVEVIDTEDQIFNTYLFEGTLEKPTAWIDWDVEANSFELQVDS